VKTKSSQRSPKRSGSIPPSDIKVSRALKAGTVWINCYGAGDTSMPFGGHKGRRSWRR
jgi:hypothetical protein